MPLSTPHYIPKGVTAAAVHAAQLLRDILDIAFALKIENGPTGPWRIPAMQHRHMTAVAEGVSETLDALQGVVSGKVAAVSDVLRCIKVVDERMARQVAETLAIGKSVAAATGAANGGAQEEALSNSENKTAAGTTTASIDPGFDAGGLLPMEVVLLIYLGMSVTQQLRILCRATVLAFLAGNKTAAEAVDVMLAEEPFLGPRQGAESVMARVLESNYWSEASAAEEGSLFEVRVHSSDTEVERIPSVESER